MEEMESTTIVKLSSSSLSLAIVNNSLRNKIGELENKLSRSESNSNTNNTLRRDAESSLSIVRRERDGLLIEKKDLEREKNE